MITVALYLCLSMGPTHGWVPDGLAAWRTLDKRGRSCASCHSPDGIELSAYTYGRRDLLRRASAHLDMGGQELVSQMILDRRAEIKSVGADPMLSRPLQPGGLALAGATAQDRDNAFLNTLPSRVPRLVGSKVASLEDAKAVCREMLTLDLSTLRVGFAMNRLSEDGFHGAEHASLAHWIPDVPIKTTPEFWSAEDRYLAAPSYRTLSELDSVVRQQFAPMTPIQDLALAKYRSLLVMQHQIRIRAKLAPAEEKPRALFADNPFWQIAEVGRVYASSDGKVLGLPQDVSTAKLKGPSLAAQMRELRLPWYWLGWIEDPSLTHSGMLKETLRADYFTETLLHDGPYASHATVMLLRKLCEQSRVPEGMRKRPWEIQFSFLLLDRHFIEWEPKLPVDKKLFRRLAGNAFRATLYLLKEDLTLSNKAVFPESQRLQIRRIDEYLKAINEPETALIENVLILLDKAKAVR